MPTGGKGSFWLRDDAGARADCGARADLMSSFFPALSSFLLLLPEEAPPLIESGAGRGEDFFEPGLFFLAPPCNPTHQHNDLHESNTARDFPCDGVRAHLRTSWRESTRQERAQERNATEKVPDLNPWAILSPLEGEGARHQSQSADCALTSAGRAEEGR